MQAVVHIALRITRVRGSSAAPSDPPLAVYDASMSDAATVNPLPNTFGAPSSSSTNPPLALLPMVDSGAASHVCFDNDSFVPEQGGTQVGSQQPDSSIADVAVADDCSEHSSCIGLDHLDEISGSIGMVEGCTKDPVESHRNREFSEYDRLVQRGTMLHKVLRKNMDIFEYIELYYAPLLENMVTGVLQFNGVITETFGGLGTGSAAGYCFV